MLQLLHQSLKNIRAILESKELEYGIINNRALAGINDFANMNKYMEVFCGLISAYGV